MLARFFSFQGRATRSEYWMLVVAYIGAALVASLLDAVAFNGNPVLSTLAYLAFLIPGLATAVRRFHDRDKSGWWVLIAFVPLIGAIWLFVELGCLRGTYGPNRFGPDPLGGELVGYGYPAGQPYPGQYPPQQGHYPQQGSYQPQQGSPQQSYPPQVGQPSPPQGYPPSHEGR